MKGSTYCGQIGVIAWWWEWGWCAGEPPNILIFFLYEFQPCKFLGYHGVPNLAPCSSLACGPIPDPSNFTRLWWAQRRWKRRWQRGWERRPDTECTTHPQLVLETCINMYTWDVSVWTSGSWYHAVRFYSCKLGMHVIYEEVAHVFRSRSSAKCDATHFSAVALNMHCQLFWFTFPTFSPLQHDTIESGSLWIYAKKTGGGRLRAFRASKSERPWHPVTLLQNPYGF